jgi:hypothetical protein
VLVRKLVRSILWSSRREQLRDALRQQRRLLRRKELQQYLRYWHHYWYAILSLFPHIAIFMRTNPVNSDYCNSNPCGAGQTCWNRVGGFSCLSSNVTYDKCTGAATVAVGVTGNGTFSFTSNGAFIPNNQFTATPGSYLVVVTDKFGFSANITVSVVAQIAFNISSANWSMRSHF